MANIEQEDRDKMISAVIHLANKDYASLVDDFMDLNILPSDSDRATIIPLMDKALSPYVKGGGAKKYEEELKKIYGMEDNDMSSQVGGFQAMTQDALTVLNDVPFSIPPYFAILGRAIVTLEGIALTGDESYGIIMEAYPFIARKLLREDRPEIQRALQEVLFSSSASAGGDGGEIKFNRLLALLNNAAGEVSKQDGGTFVNLDAVPEDGITFGQGLKFLLSDEAESLRNLLEPEVDNIVDILSRQILRKGFSEAIVTLTPPRPPSIPFLGDIFPPSPKLDEIPLPIPLPPKGGNLSEGTPTIGLLTLKDFIESAAPKLDRQEEIYAISLADAATEFFGKEVGEFVKGEGVLSVRTAQLLLSSVQKGVFLGQRGLFDSAGAQQVLEGLSSLLNTVNGGGVRDNLDGALNTIDDLDENERKRFDGILEEIIERSLKRTADRLETVSRI